MDVAVYDTFARMSQNWINNIPEVDWHGNNGNIVIGNQPASSRYTEARLSKAIEDGMFCGIKKNNVPMKLNFSEDAEMPEVLPAIFPRLLVNGCQGIGVTISNTWLPMNLVEVTDLITNYCRTGELDFSSGLIDFPTGGIILNKDELKTIHETGKGRVVLRAKTEIKNKTIFITEFPYQVFIEEWIDKVKELVEKEELTGIDDVFNKTDKDKVLVEVVCSKDPDLVLKELFSKTDLQKSLNANQFALISKTPVLLTLKDYIDTYLSHNISCVTKEYQYDLNKVSNRIEILEGLIKALAAIDDIIALIKGSDSSSDAVNKLMSTYDFTTNQAEAIVNMKLGRLARLEGVELNEELNGLRIDQENYTMILNDPNKIKEIVLNRLNDFTKKYGFKRRTQLINLSTGKDKEEVVIEPKNCIVTLSDNGTLRRVPTESYKVQKRAGKGVKNQTDAVSTIIRTTTADSLMVFTNLGKMYRILVDDIPEGTDNYLRSLVEMEPNEKPNIIYSLYKDTTAKYVLFVTKNGLIKKTGIEEYNKTKKKSGIAAISLKDDDTIATVTLVADEEIIVLTEKGSLIRFSSSEIVSTGRATSGVKAIGLNVDDKILQCIPIRDNSDMLAVFSKAGNGKRIELSEIPIQKRGGKGVIIYKEDVAAGAMVNDNDSLLVIGAKNSICIKANDITTASRIAIGTQVIKDDTIRSVSKI